MASASDRRPRLLIVSPYFPPRRRVGALRAYKLVKHLGAMGVDAAVIALATRGRCTDTEANTLACVPVLEVGAPFDRTERRSNSSHQREERVRLADPLLDRLDRLVPVDGWWPVFAARAGAIARFADAFAPDVVLGTADPWSSLLVARAIARRRAVPFVADLRDPWTLCEVRGHDRPPLVRWLDRRIEAEVLAEASTVVFTAENATERYRVHYGARIARIETIPNGFDGTDDTSAIAARLPRIGRYASPGPTLELLHFGGFRSLAPATPLIEVLARLRREDPAAAAAIRVRSVGPLPPDDRRHAEAAGVGGCFEPIAPVPYEDALLRQQAADALLVVADARRHDMIPAKLFDALPTGRPILAFAPNPEVGRILEHTGCGVAFGDLDEATRVLGALARAKRAGAPLPLPLAPDAATIASYGARHAAARFASIVRELAA